MAIQNGAAGAAVHEVSRRTRVRILAANAPEKEQLAQVRGAAVLDRFIVDHKNRIGAVSDDAVSMDVPLNVRAGERNLLVFDLLWRLGFCGVFGVSLLRWFGGDGGESGDQKQS